VSFGQVNNDDEFERAFAGATVHDMFNFLTVAVMLPIELIFHPLELMTDGMKPETVEDGEPWEGPVKQWVAPLVKRVINANKDVIKNVAKGSTTCEEIYADDDVKGLIKCGDVLNPFTGEETKICPLFYKEHASKADDMASGTVCLMLSIFGLCFCLYALVKILQSIVLSSSTALIKRSTNINPYFAMVVGCGVTLLVQSSSITTSVLTPLVGLDIIKLEQMFPLTLGANIGTTATALLASMVSTKPESVQIALCHLFFNVFGILVWFPIPRMREIPIAAAKQLGTFTRKYKGFPVFYILVAFVLVPGVLLGVSSLFDKGGAFIALGSLFVVVLIFIGGKMAWFFKKEDGLNKLYAMLEERQANNVFQKGLKEKVTAMEERLALLENGGVAKSTKA
jgi:sodium-dependent phosphate cotransporter